MSRPRRSTAGGRSARDVALDVLLAVELDDAYANLDLSRRLAEQRTDRRDAALATELVFGSLRLRGRYDAVLDRCSSRALDDIDPVTRNALRLGTHQLLTLATPDYAAVSATVDQVSRRRGAGAARFANAVLRSVSKQPWLRWREELLDGLDPVAAWEVEWSHPAWIIRSLQQALLQAGAPDEIDSLLQRNDDPAPVTLVARPGRLERARLLSESGGTHGQWSPWAVRITGDPGRVASVRSGAAGVQDEGSQLMALALSRLDTPPGDWLDLCAGPGGKTADLAGLAAAAGASLTAVEQHPHRAELIRRTVRGGPPVDVLTGDATVLSLQPAARILLDAPCTGLGAIRRRPELRWRRTPADLPALRAAQTRLLDRALGLLVPGGCVAYVTCSPHVAETSAIVDAARSRHPGTCIIPAPALIPEVAATASGADGQFVQLWPQRHDTDAMFLAILRRDS